MDIHQLVRNQINEYTRDDVVINSHVTFNMHDTIEKIEAYLYSKFISGSEDSLGRKKPFFNIVRAASNIWWRATDLDTKDIRIKANKQDDYFRSYVATLAFRNWMKKARFGTYLNEWGKTLARYGSAVTKFVETDGKLEISVIPWNRFICDPVDADSAPKIERLFLTPQQLQENPLYDADVVDNLIETVRQSRKTLDEQTVDNRNNFIEVWEVHGELPLSMLTGKPEDTEYVQQMHVLAQTQGEDKDGKDDKDFTLYQGREAKDPYYIAHLLKEDGRTLAVGAVESLFDPQEMVNHSVKAMKDQLEIASKLFFQTADPQFASRNVIQAIETGDILTHAHNQPLTQVNSGGHDIAALQAYGQNWRDIGQELTSTQDAIQGNTMPSGTPFRQVAILNREVHSLFEMFTENKGLALEDMIRTYIIPHIQKKLKTTEQIAAHLDSSELEWVDKAHAQHVARKLSIEAMLDGQLVTQDMYDAMVNAQLTTLDELGDERFFTTPKSWTEYFKGFEWDAEIEITGENLDKQAALTTLFEVLQVITRAPEILQDPTARGIFNQILETAGNISPIQIQDGVPTAPVGGLPAPETTGVMQ